MKAWGARQFLPVNDPACLLEFDAPDPVIGPLDLLVRIRAIALNPVDTKIRASLGDTIQDPPRILGWDAAGVVESVGSESRGFARGDEVFYSGDLTRPGCNAEFQAVDSRVVAHKPASWSFHDAAALPLVTITAWELLFERMGIDPHGNDRGQPLLIINGAGGVGSAMIAMARSAGLEVFATASRTNTREWCQQLGARHVLDHRQPLRPQMAALGMDAFPYIVNLYNTEAYWEVTADLIAPMGALGLIVEPGQALHLGDPLKAKCVRIAWEFMGARTKFKLPDMHRQGEILELIAERCATGEFPCLTTRVFDACNVENLRTGHAAMEQASAHGKWVLEVSPA